MMPKPVITTYQSSYQANRKIATFLQLPPFMIENEITDGFHCVNVEANDTRDTVDLLMLIDGKCIRFISAALDQNIEVDVLPENTRFVYNESDGRLHLMSDHVWHTDFTFPDKVSSYQLYEYFATFGVSERTYPHQFYPLIRTNVMNDYRHAIFTGKKFDAEFAPKAGENYDLTAASVRAQIILKDHKIMCEYASSNKDLELKENVQYESLINYSEIADNLVCVDMMSNGRNVTVVLHSMVPGRDLLMLRNLSQNPNGMIFIVNGANPALSGYFKFNNPFSNIKIYLHAMQIWVDTNLKSEE